MKKGKDEKINNRRSKAGRKPLANPAIHVHYIYLNASKGYTDAAINMKSNPITDKIYC